MSISYKKENTVKRSSFKVSCSANQKIKLMAN